VISVSGVYQVSDLVCKLVAQRWKAELEIDVANPFALVFGGDADVARLASPLTHVCEGLPPFLVVYAERDLPTLGEMAVRFDAALRAKKCDVKLMKVEDRNHITVFTKSREPEERLARAVVAFVRKDRRAAKD
jgi:acetyl esterase/lipase